MTTLFNQENQFSQISASDLLGPGERVVIVDDSPEIILIFQELLENQGFSVSVATNAAEFYKILEHEQVGLALLDIGLPDQSGESILEDIASRYPDLAIIMVTGETDLETALNCLRKGADDYLAKPVHINSFTNAIQKMLEKRRLAIDNRNYQKALELTNFRTNFLHQLNLKMNTAYLNAVELDNVLQAILVGITAEEGLKFNRAFLALFNKEQKRLKGRLAIGPSCKEEAGRVWNGIKGKELHLSQIISNMQQSCVGNDHQVNRVVKELYVPATDTDHLLIRACRERKPILVKEGKALGEEVCPELLELLGESNFVVAPLYSPSRSLGIIIADNFITGNPIEKEDVTDLEIFASQASLAIEHSHMYRDMRAKIHELEITTTELDKNKDLLVEAERYSALGHMAAQLVHAIRNPITSIGGTSRLLAKKTDDPKMQKFMDLMAREAVKVESTLDDLFNFVGTSSLEVEEQPLYPLIRKTVMLFYTSMKKQNIHYKLNLEPPEPSLRLDGKRIRQLFLHLIRNGVEAMETGGTLTIGSHIGDSGVTVEISDTGAGIADSNLARVKDPFFTTKTYGTGMGLTLVEKIVSEHDGLFKLQRDENGGMKAIVTLPWSGVEQ
ncbi:MAG: response regulator [Thermodesulfobacteriota bacterium]